jgi:RNA polymerase sigma-70 factor (ECF subfamily)
MNAQDADRAADAVGNGLADRFESERPRLQAIAYRILGSLGEAEDAVQESWLRLSRALTRPAVDTADTAGSPPDSPADSPISNLPGWLTTTVSRICLDMLRTRASRREDLVVEPDPASAPTAAPASSPFAEPEDEALLADATGRALLVVLDRLSPPERVAFVLHDAFAVPFDEIAHIVDRSPQTTKKLASRARLKVRGGTTLTPDSASAAELARQRRVAEKFLSAARSGDLRAIIELLAPDVVRRADPAALTPGRPLEVRGADAVAKEITLFGQASRYAEPALINGTTIGVLVAPRGRLHLVLALTIDAMSDLITAYELVADPGRLSRLDLAVLGVRAQ